MTAMDDDNREPSISSEDVKANEADKYVESHDKPESRRKTPWVLLGTTVVTGLLAFMLGLGLGLGVIAFATPDQVRGKPSAEARPVPSYSMPIGTGGIPPNCQQQPWGFLGHKVRSICDGPIQPDGSWMRRRIVGIPGHYEYPSSSCSGGSYSSYCTFYPGGWVDEVDSDDETYPVTPDTVLPDEPGHLG